MMTGVVVWCSTRNVKWVGNQRDRVDFSPKDTARVQAFLREEEKAGKVGDGGGGRGEGGEDVGVGGTRGKGQGGQGGQGARGKGQGGVRGEGRGARGRPGGHGCVMGIVFFGRI